MITRLSSEFSTAPICRTTRRYLLTFLHATMRQLAGRYTLAACLLLAGLGVLFVFSNHEPVKKEGETTRAASTSVSVLVANTSQTERTNIFFLKAHKCASSTVQNILLRFGLERGLDFVLPSKNNYIGNPKMFSSDMIDDEYMTKSGKFHIFAHHSRYDSYQVRSVMYNDAAYVTILRYPADVYESIFSYYKLQKLFNVTFEELLKDPKSVKNIKRRHYNRIGFNQMSWDLGLQEEYYRSANQIEMFIKKIQSEFDLVMISEWMEVSLVLLADLMNWPLENVVSLKLNSRIQDSIYVMSDVERDKVVELNNIDFLLYSHFVNEFKKKVIEYGEERMKNDVEKLLILNTKLKLRCVREENSRGFGHTQAYILHNGGDRLCFFAARGELEFTEYLRQVQRHRLKVLSGLDILLYSHEDLL